MTRRKGFCTREITAGPGSCWYWWEGCPAKAKHCFMRHVRANGGEIDLAQAEAWQAARNKARDPQPTLDGIA
jgi:hypothetical protein